MFLAMGIDYNAYSIILMFSSGMFLAMGIGHLQKADVTSTRNLFVVGFSVFFGVCISRWTSMNEDKITVSK